MRAVLFPSAIFLSAAQIWAASEPDKPPTISGTVITNMTQLWALPSEEKILTHRVQMQLLVYYSNPNWSVFWGRSDGADTFLPLRGIPVPLKLGDKVFIDGQMIPVNQEFLWDKTSIKILSESNEIQSVSIQGRLLDAENLKGHFVEETALVDSQELISTNVVKLRLVAENFNFTATINIQGPDELPPGLVGKFVRIRGVYAATPDTFGKVASIALWTPGLRQVEITGSLDSDPRFSVPVTSAENFSRTDPKTMVRVSGTVRSQQPGQAVTIWDDSGQIYVLGKQMQSLRLGDRIDAVGYPEVQGIDHTLRDALFRLAPNGGTTAGEGLTTNRVNLRLAEQVRSLDQEQIAQKLPVNIEGVVTWVDARRNYIYVLDSSGGIRVLQPQLRSGRRLQAGMTVRLNGVAIEGEFAPAITNAVLRQTGVMSLPDAPLVSYEQAMTGTEDGRWIQMRGFVRKISDEGNTLRLQLIASGGEFTARVPRTDGLRNLQGSVILIRGVCVADANSRRQLTGIELWSPAEECVQVEQSASADMFALSARSIASLRQFNLFNTLDDRVRTHGSVTLAVPGHYLYVQDGSYSIFALSDQTDPLRSGDRVEIVGFRGNDNGKLVLRDAEYRRISSGPEPPPLQLATTNSMDEDLDGRLVRAEGSLLDVIEKPEEIRLLIRAQGLNYEARIDATKKLGPEKIEVGSRLAITGIYRIQSDEDGKPRSFLLNLRNEDDIKVLQAAPWWTLPRLLWALAGVAGTFLIALFWAFGTERKNSLLVQAQAELKAAHGKLEERVQERTKELRTQVAAKERALGELSNAQERLMLASRHAGMAEVATGVLHNVGNVLNSVNVSASLVGDSLRRFRVENLSKAVALLNEQDGKLAAFLTDDPRGRALPGYLQSLAHAMTENQQNAQAEIASLTKQIDHVKVIVSMQQNYSKISGCHENLDPVEVMEDAIQINRAAFERHQIELIHEYQETPKVFVDRHKVLQILINLLSNAKYAMKERTANPRRVVLRIRTGAENRVRLEVADTGVGIAPENLDRIFTLGFTTKSGGHGFGLHSGANAAKEMGGQISVFSEGIGQGATFVLELPAARESGPGAKTPANPESTAATEKP
jgi:signal transduction histidine kinase